MTTRKTLTSDELYSKHSEEIKIAAEDAKRVISFAASDAAKAVAEAAAISVKVLSVKNSDDHDLLIKLNTLMEVMNKDINDLKTGTFAKLEDHESRIKATESKITNYSEDRLKAIETKTSNYTITLQLFTLAVTAMFGLMLYHIFNT